jgi:hypothetical protein
MEGFQRILEAIPGLRADRVYREEEARILKESVLLATAMLIRDLYPSDGCTFTGMLIMRQENGLRGLLFHAGDSLLYRVDTGSGSVKRLTENNFWFVGRADRFSQVEEVPLDAPSRLVFATDGFASLLPSGEGSGTELGEICRRYPVEEIPDLLFERYDRPGEVLDERRVPVPAPREGRAGPPFILGGTSAAEEQGEEGISRGILRGYANPCSGRRRRHRHILNGIKRIPEQKDRSMYNDYFVNLTTC